jgi:hypothetical protein
VPQGTTPPFWPALMRRPPHPSSRRPPTAQRAEVNGGPPGAKMNATPGKQGTDTQHAAHALPQQDPSSTSALHEGRLNNPPHRVHPACWLMHSTHMPRLATASSWSRRDMLHTRTRAAHTFQPNPRTLWGQELATPERQYQGFVQPCKRCWSPSPGSTGAVSAPLGQACAGRVLPLGATPPYCLDPACNSAWQSCSKWRWLRQVKRHPLVGQHPAH